MNARAVALIAQDPARWALAGDQLYVDLDMSAGRALNLRGINARVVQDGSIRRGDIGRKL